jgi:hypothetical protein
MVSESSFADVQILGLALDIAVVGQLRVEEAGF